MSAAPSPVDQALLDLYRAVHTRKTDDSHTSLVNTLRDFYAAVRDADDMQQVKAYINALEESVS